MIKIYFSLLLLFLLTSCTSEFELFEETALEYAQSDEIITLTERAELVQKIKLFSEDRKFKIFFTGDSFEEEKLLNYFRKKEFKYETADPPTAAKDTHVNVYIENSGSMNGYVNGSTEFKAAIQDLLVLLKYEYNEENLQIFFINSDIHPTGIARDLAGFTSALNAKSFKVGNTAGSNLNSIFNKVLAKTSKDTMSILISDCIYSIQGSKTQELLSDQKSLTKDAFLTKSKTEKLATTIVKLSSAFNGNYWDMNNKPTTLTNQQRPYYIAIIGSGSAMSHFNSKIELSAEKVQGYEDKYMLSTSQNPDVFYSIINTSFDNGSYRVSRDLISNNAIQGIENIRVDDRTNAPFRFSIAVDFSSLPVTESQISNLNNYYAEGYEVSEVYKIDAIKDKLKKPSLNALDKMPTTPTHIVVLESKSSTYRSTDLIFKKQIPRWVTDSSTEDDTNMSANQDKTFGFSYLIEGITEAYEITTNSPHYFRLNLNLKN